MAFVAPARCGWLGPREPDGHQHVCRYPYGHGGLHSYEVHAIEVLRGKAPTDKCCGVKRNSKEPTR